MLWKLCLIFAVVAATNAAVNYHTYIACEGQHSTASCPPHTVIKVQNGFYGRKTRNICPHRNIHTTSCSASGSLNKIIKACDKKNECVVWARNNVFGDPCRGTHKYVTFTYTCVPEIKTLLACEHARPVTASCSEGYFINVLSGYYGRKNRYQCPSSNIHTTKCEAAGSLQKIKNACNKKRTCNIRAHNSVFGDPCRGTVKYLLYTYNCIPHVVPRKDYEVNICEGSKASLYCPHGTTLKVTGGFYGRLDFSTCPSGNIYSTTCGNPSSGVKLNQLCHNKNSCFLHASNSVFGDPCRGTYKYLRMFYQCA